MASHPNGTIYIGVTSDLVKRVYEHRSGVVDGFTSKYSCKRLVYFEKYDDIRDAISREKYMKKWKRVWKLKRIYETNSDWCDLWEEISNP